MPKGKSRPQPFIPPGYADARPTNQSPPGAGPLDWETDLPEGIAPPESWDEFFEAQEGIVTCHVRRRWPEMWNDPTTGKETNAVGFCGEVPYGVDVERYISEHWGGGHYQVSLLVNHKFKKSRKVSIAGPPILTPRVAPTFIPNAPANGSGESGVVLAEDPGVTTDVSLAGSRNDWEERLTRFAATQQMIRAITPPAPPDLNASLLALVVNLIGNQAKGDSSSSLKEQLENLQTLQEITGSGSGSGGSSVLDLIGKAMDVLPKLAAMSQLKGSRAALPRPELPSPAPALADPQLEDPETAPPAQEDSLTQYQEMLDRALDTIATHYSLESRTAPAVVAGALMVAYPLPIAIRDRVKNYASELAVLGFTQLGDAQLAASNALEAWTSYVVAVLESYADPNRKGPLEGLKL